MPPIAPTDNAATTSPAPIFLRNVFFVLAIADNFPPPTRIPEKRCSTPSNLTTRRHREGLLYRVLVLPSVPTQQLRHRAR